MKTGKSPFPRVKIYRMYSDGLSFDEIAKEVGAKSPDYIRQIVNSAILKGNLKKREDVVAAIDTGKIKALRKARWTIHAIADDCGCTEEDVQNVLGEKTK